MRFGCEWWRGIRPLSIEFEQALYIVPEDLQLAKHWCFKEGVGVKRQVFNLKDIVLVSDLDYSWT